MFDIETEKKFSDNRMIEQLIVKITPQDKYIIRQYQLHMDIENRSSWILSLIKNDINEKIERGFVEIH